MAGVAKLLGGHIINRGYKEVDLNDRRFKGTIIGLYFSASWCPPCRTFTPYLSQIYKYYQQEKNLKIIYISSDHDLKSFIDYYNTMPWLALDYRAWRKREELSKRFNVTGIPKLVLIDGDSGETICTNAKDQLHLDVEGRNFPWKSSIFTYY